MQNQKENLFRNKFHLLNSQEHNEDIKWSSSSSSEYENTSNNEKFIHSDKTRHRKRKRKIKVSKNMSNLDITTIGSCKGAKNCMATEKSPILVSKRVKSVKVRTVSPILTSNTLPPNKDSDKTSPILSNKRFHPKSPIFNLKSTSPSGVDQLGKVRKKLSYEKYNNKSNEGILDYQKSTNIKNNTSVESEANSITSLDSSEALKTKLMEKVKNFFDSHFSSESTSQNISDIPTPTDCVKNEEIDILSCKTQTVASIQTTKLDISNSDTSSFDKCTKKVKYKKGGLAYRLNSLLKKQNAHISLWHHERYLAGNSDFVIPKEENVIFRIKSVEYKYGCHLLNTVDLVNKKYIIIINSKYVNRNIVVDSVFKLYEPYKVLIKDQDVTIIVSVCKFECVDIKE